MAASLQLRRSTIALLPVFSAALFGQARAVEPIKASLCELVKDPESFNNKLVEVRSEFASRFGWEGFADETCSAKIKWDAYGVLDDLRAQDGRTHLPVHPKQDDNYRAFRKYADLKFKWPDGGRCQDCPLYRIVVTADGRFDYFPTQTASVRANPEMTAFGYAAGYDPNVALLRFVLQSVSDVSAMPIDPSVYLGKKPRDVTLEEAEELVTVVLRHHGGYALDPYEVESIPDFEFYQALWVHPHGTFFIHYAVDRKTGEVWGVSSCENLTSPSLEKLQKAIRNRIGLTADQFQKLRRRGPYCDP